MSFEESLSTSYGIGLAFVLSHQMIMWRYSSHFLFDIFCYFSARLS